MDLEKGTSFNMKATKVLPSHIMIWVNRNYLVLVMTPIILCPIPIVFANSIGYMAYVQLLMAIFWVTEALPIAITGMIPIALFPFFGIMSTGEVTKHYSKDIVLFVLSSLMVALAVEEWNLHKRIALRVLMLMGSKPQWLMIGFMWTTAFLSMWMVNTAACAMMIPIAQAVLGELKQTEGDVTNQATEEPGYVLLPRMGINTNDDDKEDNNEGKGILDAHFSSDRIKDEKRDNEMEAIHIFVEPDDKMTSEHDKNFHDDTGSHVESRNYTKLKARGPNDNTAAYKNLCKCFMVCVPYGANIGGTATIIGTPPNLVLVGQLQSLYGTDAGINFATYLLYGFPQAVVCLILASVWLQWFYIDRPNRQCCGRALRGKSSGTPTNKDVGQQTRVAKYIRDAYKELGPISFAEKAVLCHWIVLILLWITRDPKFAPGWSSAYPKNFVKDASSTFLIIILLFVCPSQPPSAILGIGRYATSERKPIRPLLSWRSIQRKVPWEIFFLIGGGFAMAEGCKVSGLSRWLSQQFLILSGFPPGVIALIVSFTVSIFTEVISNNATAAVLLPLLGDLSVGLGVNPMYLMLSAAIACSFAFMLPVGTAPNAIAFSYGHLKIIDMVKAGVVLNILCVLVANVSINTLGVWIFDIRTYPDWAITKNATSSM